MKINDIITETTAAAGIAVVAPNIGSEIKRNPSVFPSNKTKAKKKKTGPSK